MLCLRTNLAIGPSSWSCTYTRFVSQGVEIDLIFTVWAAVSEIKADFQNFHIHVWARNWAIVQSSRSCTYALFLPQGVKIELIFSLRAAVFEICGRFSKCHIWARNLEIGQSSKSCTYTLSTPGGQNLAYFHSTGGGFRDTFRDSFKIAIFGYETWQLAKVPEVAHILSFYHKGSQLSLFLLYGQRFSRYGDDFQNCHIWAWNLAIGQSDRSCTYTPYASPWVPNFTPFCCTAGHFQDIGSFPFSQWPQR